MLLPGHVPYCVSQLGPANSGQEDKKTVHYASPVAHRPSGLAYRSTPGAVVVYPACMPTSVVMCVVQHGAPSGYTRSLSPSRARLLISSPLEDSLDCSRLNDCLGLRWSLFGWGQLATAICFAQVQSAGCPYRNGQVPIRVDDGDHLLAATRATCTYVYNLGEWHALLLHGDIRHRTLLSRHSGVANPRPARSSEA